MLFMEDACFINIQDKPYIIRALITNIVKKNKVVQLLNKYSKNLYFTVRKSIEENKGSTLFHTEEAFTKDEILEMCLNEIFSNRARDSLLALHI